MRPRARCRTKLREPDHRVDGGPLPRTAAAPSCSTAAKRTQRGSRCRCPAGGVGVGVPAGAGRCRAPPRYRTAAVTAGGLPAARPGARAVRRRARDGAARATRAPGRIAAASQPIAGARDRAACATRCCRRRAGRAGAPAGCRRKADEFETLFNSSPIGLAFAQDPQCRTVTAQRRRWMRCFGLPQSHGAGAVQVLRQGEPLERGEQPLQRAARTGEAVAGDGARARDRRPAADATCWPTPCRCSTPAAARAVRSARWSTSPSASRPRRNC